VGGKRKINPIDQLVQSTLDLRLHPPPPHTHTHTHTHTIEEPEMKLSPELPVDGF